MIENAPECPNCGGDDEIAICEYVLRFWRNAKIRAEVIHVESDSDEIEFECAVRPPELPKGDSPEAFMCLSCSHRWPIPEGLSFEWE